MRDPERKDQAVVERDLKLFKDIIEFGGIPEERDLNIHIVVSNKDVDKMIRAIRGVVSVDLETTSLYPWHGHIVSIGIGTAEGEFMLFMYHHDSEWDERKLRVILWRITAALQSCICVFQNGKFDALWILMKYGYVWHNDFDTMLAHYLCDENDLHDLTHLAKLYYNAFDWDIPTIEKQGQAPILVIAKYQAHDLYYTRKLYFTLKEKLAKQPYVRRVFYKLMMPIANLFAKMEMRGCYLDLSKMDDAEEYLVTEMAAAEERLNKWGKINWGSPKQIGELLYDKLKIKCPAKTPKGKNSTSESTLKQIDHQSVGDLLAYRGHRQQHSFFIEGWKPFIVDKRIHPSFKLHGTVTGRPSCEHPNFQQVPRDPRIRTLITAPPGYVLMEADLSQIELRIVAELSRDPVLMQTFLDGKDAHWLTALRELERGYGLPDQVVETARIAKQLKKPPQYTDAIEILLEIGPDAAAEIDPAWKEVRKKAKAVNFGYVFGMWWKKFIIYARDNYGMKLTDKQAQDSRRSFFELYKLEGWHRSQQSFAKEMGHVNTLTGRKRRLPAAMGYHDTPERAEALRQAINSPVQGFASELNLMTLLEMVEHYPDPEEFQPTITVHDAILSEVRLDMVEEVADTFDKVMRHPRLLDVFGINLTVPICGEVKIGPWGAGVSVEKWLKQRRKLA